MGSYRGVAINPLKPKTLLGVVFNQSKLGLGGITPVRKLPLYLANLKTFFAKKDKMGLKAMKRIEGTPTGDCTTSKKQRFSEKSHASHKTSVRKYIQKCFLNLHVYF